MSPQDFEAETEQRVQAEDLRDAWTVLDPADRVEGFRALSSGEAEQFFLEISALDRAHLILGLPTIEQRWWIRALAPDDVADVVQEAPPDERLKLMHLLDEATRREVNALLAYAEDEAGGLMNPRYARLRPDMTVDEAISYLRRQTRERVESIYYAYVLDDHQVLVGVVSFRQLMMARREAKVREIMITELVTVHAEMDQEAVSRVFAEADLLSVPVVDPDGRMQGIVTADDIVDVVREEATEDIQKIGGSAALEAPYLQVGFVDMMKKRAGWLCVLFVGGTLTVSAIGHFQERITRIGYLETFIAMIISCGGNCGSQASTLVIRAMALGEVRLRDWWRVFLRELGAGLALGATLGLLGLLRIVAWHHLFEDGGQPMYGANYLLIAVTVAFSVIGVSTWGTLVGAILPFVLKRFGLDPASASAPLVATLSDVTGIVIFFSISIAVLSGATPA
ncbi:MAG: magnesium transporter [Planctomycetes bacterium]|nr:magnesium transporter [Planctomycetota bacterium]